MSEKHEITSMILDEVSVVDDPANPEANIIITKAKFTPCADCKTPDVCKSKGCSLDKSCNGDHAVKKSAAVMAEIAKALREFSPAIIERVGAALPSDTEAAEMAAFFLKEKSMDIEDLNKALGEAKTALDQSAAVIKTKDDEIAKLKTERDEAIAKTKAPPAKEQTEEDLLKSLPEALRKRFVAMEAASKVQADEIEKMRTEREEAEAIEKARGLAGDPKVVGPVLMRIRKGKATDADVAEIERLLKAQAAQEKTANLYKTHGSSVAVDGNPEDLLKAKAEDIAKAKNISFAKAYAEVLEANPDLYNAYLAKRRPA